MRARRSSSAIISYPRDRLGGVQRAGRWVDGGLWRAGQGQAGGRSRVAAISAVDSDAAISAFTRVFGALWRRSRSSCTRRRFGLDSGFSARLQRARTTPVDVACRVPKQPTLRCAGVLFSDARLRPSPCFPSPLPKERDGAPGGAQEVCETSSAGCAKPGYTPSFRDPRGLRRWGSRARGPLRGARAPLGAPLRHALSAAAPCSVIRCRDRRRLRLSKALAGVGRDKGSRKV